MIKPSIAAAVCRFTGTPIETKVRPEEYKSRIAPPIKPKMATSANGIKYQVGNKVVSAPIGSEATSSLNSGLLAANNEP